MSRSSTPRLRERQGGARARGGGIGLADLAALALLVAAGYLTRTESSSEKARQPAATAERRCREGAAGEGADRGRGAGTPFEIPSPGWRDIAWRTYEQISIDRVLAVAAGCTFYALLALFPAITALISLYGLFADRAAVVEHLDTLSGILPASALDLIGGQMERIAAQPPDALGTGFFVGLAIAAWSSNQGMKAMFDALNVAYRETETRGIIKLNFITLTFTLAMIVFVLLAIAALVALPIVFDFGALEGPAAVAVGLARWPLLLIAVAAIISIMYRFGPSRAPARWRWITPGSVLATVVWMLASLGFSWYAANFASYNETYGSLGAVIVFMTWIWVSATIILVGAELNGEIERQTMRDSTTGEPLPMGMRGATVADELGRSP